MVVVGGDVGHHRTVVRPRHVHVCEEMGVWGCLRVGCLKGGCLRGGCLRGGCLKSGCLRSGCLRSGCLKSGCLRSGCLTSGCLRGGCLRRVILVLRNTLENKFICFCTFLEVSFFKVFLFF